MKGERVLGAAEDSKKWGEEGAACMGLGVS